MSNDAITAAMAELEKAKEKRKSCSHWAAVAGRTMVEWRAKLIEWEATIARLTEQYDGQIEAELADDAEATEQQLIKARIRAQIWKRKIAKREETRKAAVSDVVAAKNRVKAAALAVCVAERAELLERFIAAVDHAELLGDQLRDFTGPDEQIPMEVKAALARIPVANGGWVHTPVNKLREQRGHASQVVWASATTSCFTTLAWAGKTCRKSMQPDSSKTGRTARDLRTVHGVTKPRCTAATASPQPVGGTYSMRNGESIRRDACRVGPMSEPPGFSLFSVPAARQANRVVKQRKRAKRVVTRQPGLGAEVQRKVPTTQAREQSPRRFGEAPVHRGGGCPLITLRNLSTTFMENLR